MADAPPPKRSSARGPFQPQRQERRKASPADRARDVRGIDRRLRDVRLPAPVRRRGIPRDMRGMAIGAVADQDKAPANGSLSHPSGGRPPVRRAGPPHCGITGYDRRGAAISGRFACGYTRDYEKPAVAYVFLGNKRCRFAGFYGSDGTRTRDLRRDRPVLAVRAAAGMNGDLRPEQALSTATLRGLPGVGGSFRGRPAGSVRDAIVV
jgi:hypothetical protein